MDSPIAKVLEAKSHHVEKVDLSATVASAVGLMNEREIGSVLVFDGARLVGIFTERDVVRLYAEGDDLTQVTVEQRMTCSVVLGKPDDSIDSVMSLMTERRFRHLPVVDGGTLLGLVSIGDVVKAKLDEAAKEAETLREYIHS